MMQQKSRFDVVGQLIALRRYARSLARNDADAEDLVHDTLVRAYEKRSTFRSDRNLRTWLLSILHNVFVDGTRARRAEVLRIGEAADLTETHVGAGQDHVVRLAQVRENFMALPPEQRAALHLVAIEDLSYSEAAATLGVPVGTLMSRLGRARETLRAIEDEGAPRVARLKVVGGSNDRAR